MPLVKMIADFRDNPKLGDGKLDLREKTQKNSDDFRDNPKLGDGKTLLFGIAFS